MEFLSNRMSRFELATLIEEFWYTCTMLELLIVGLLPQKKQDPKHFKWDQKVTEKPMASYKWLKHAGNTASIPFMGSLSSLGTEVVLARLNWIAMIREEKGGVLPAEMLEDLQKGVVWWDANQTNTLPILKRLLHYMGHNQNRLAPDWKTTGTKVPAFAEKTPYLGDPQAKWEGNVWGSKDLFQHWWLQDQDFGGYLDACATKRSKDAENKLLLYKTLWVEWTEEGIRFPDKMRENRNYYTLRAACDTHWLDNPHVLWGNQLMWWCMGATSLGQISKAINRDATELVAPSRVYGDPSPLNRSQDRNTVGHLTLALPSVGHGARNSSVLTPLTLTDIDAYAPILAAEFAYEAGLPVLYQHQLESTRVGEVAAACGKSTVVLVVKLDNGKLRRIKLSIGQFLTDKAAKLFNRDSLLGRCPAIVKVNRKEDQAVDDDQAQAFLDMADKLLS